ncbi:MAG: hypothetical protein HYW81_00215 [Parcubacteria group bacterium]|nr:hypothetical protein [Parcubacteria group bacterium]
MSFRKLTHGQVTSRDLVITAVATLAVAAAMVAAFAVLGGRSGQQGSDDEAAELINQIKQQAAREETVPTQETTQTNQPASEDVRANEVTISGTLMGINGKTLSILDSATEEEREALLTDRTIAVYNGSVFDQRNFSVGDVLSVRAVLNKQAYEAVTITVQFSASPKTEAPVPQGLQERPGGTLQPLGNE